MKCIGCDAEADKHPWIVVTQNKNGNFVAKPVCTPCWKEPEHRKHPIKGHYFQAHQAAQAVAAAGHSTIQG